MRKINLPSIARPLFLGICIGIFIKLFAFDFLVVRGKSMEPVLHDGETILVNKLAYGLTKPFGSSLLVSWNQPQNGEIVAFLYNNHLVIKRCAAVENTLLEYSTESGYTLKVNDVEYPLTEMQYNLLKETTLVPSGTVLAIGDNHEHSIDSRTYGFVPVANILGRVMAE